MIIIDAKNKILGRVASYAASEAMLGEEVVIINCEEAAISGRKKWILDSWAYKKSMGAPAKGPIYFKSADRFVKRTIRGMLDKDTFLGKKALKRIMCYKGTPKKFEGKQTAELKKMDVGKLQIVKFAKVKDVCRVLGVK